MIPDSLSFLGKRYVPEVGEYTLFFHNEDRNTNIYDWDVRDCAGGGDGCPAVMVIRDAPDTILDKQWQFYLVAINQGMRLNNIATLLKRSTALTNDPDGGCRNYILGENLGAPECPRLDKFRTFSRNTHAAVPEGDRWRLITQNGNQPPALKPGRSYPASLDAVRLDDYLFTPATHPYLFLVCNNVQKKPGGMTSVFPFTGGVVRPWLDSEIYTFFPFVSKFPQYIDPQNWTRLDPGTSVYPYRRV